MNTTEAEELDSRYIITKPGYKFGKLIRQPSGGFHCPHIGCDYASMAQTSMGMHRKSKHGHIPLHSHKTKNPGSRGGQVTARHKVPVQKGEPNILTGEILMLRRMQVLAELADFILSTRRTGNNGAL